LIGRRCGQVRWSSKANPWIINSEQTMTEIQAIVEPNEFPSSALMSKKWHVQDD
jgi:hypothetical protein